MLKPQNLKYGDEGFYPGVEMYHVYSDENNVGEFGIEYSAWHKQNGCFALVWAVKIFDEYRGKGYGNLLMADMLELCRSLGVKKVGLFVNKHNTAAVHLYEKSGFQFVPPGRGERMYGGEYYQRAV